jgi:hypothetical protein
VKALRLGFRAFQFVEARQRRVGGRPRETVAHERGVDEQPVLAKHVRGLSMPSIESPAVVLQPHPAMEDHLDQAVARFLRERRRRPGSAARFRRRDAEQPNAAEGRDGNRVAIVDRVDHHRLGSSGSRAERNGLSYCHGRD